MHETDGLARRVGAAGALLLFIGLLTGIFASFAMTGQLPFPIQGRTTLSAHLSALMGSFFIFGVAWSLPHVRVGARTLARMAWVIVVAQYANWLVTTVKSTLFVSGLALNQDARNNAVFGTLTATVVLPSLIAAGVWCYGLLRRT